MRILTGTNPALYDQHLAKGLVLGSGLTLTEDGAGRLMLNGGAPKEVTDLMIADSTTTIALSGAQSYTINPTVNRIQRQVGSQLSMVGGWVWTGLTGLYFVACNFFTFGTVAPVYGSGRIYTSLPSPEVITQSWWSQDGFTSCIAGYVPLTGGNPIHIQMYLELPSVGSMDFALQDITVIYVGPISTWTW